MYALAHAMKDCLSNIKGVNTVKIGIESALSPSDYPLIRIVPVKREHGAAFPRERLETDVFFGVPATESDRGLEAVYESLDVLERAVVNALEKCDCFTAQFQGTQYDEDAVAGYKVGVAKFTVSG